MTEIFSYLEDIQHTYGDAEYLKIIKTGKEAEVHLLRVNGQYLALKVYKENKKFSSRQEYLSYEDIGDKRLRRAARKKTRKGLSVVKHIWVNREYEVLEKLYRLDALVPRPYMRFENATLMEYLGDIDSPALRLCEVILTNDEAERLFRLILDHIRIFLDLGFTHGDLSPFNILWFNNLPYFIDFPQIVNIEMSSFEEKFSNDLNNIKKYFGRYDIKNIEKEISAVYNEYLKKKYGYLSEYS